MKHGSKIWFSTLPLFLVCGVLFLVSERLSFRRDLTQDHIYSLSSASRELLDRVEDPLTFKLYISENLPPKFKPVEEYALNLIREYEAAAPVKGLITVEVSDPKADLESIALANRLGVRETRANIKADDRAELIHLWFGLAIVYGDHHQSFPSLPAIEDLEFEISAALLRLVDPSPPKVGWLGPIYEYGNGGFQMDIQHQLGPAYEEASQMFDIEQVGINGDIPLNLDIYDGLLVWGIHHFSEARLYELDQFMMTGKPVMLLVSGNLVDPVAVAATPLEQGIGDQFLAHLGVAVKRNLVLDTACTKIRFRGPEGLALKDYPLFPALNPANGSLDPSFPPTADIHNLVLAWPSELTILPESDLQTRVIGESSDQAWLQQQPYQIAPSRVPGPTEFQRYTLGLMVTGRIPSFFPQSRETEHIDRSPPTQIMIWGSEHVLAQAVNSATKAWINQSLAFMTKHRGLQGVPRREHAVRPIRALERAERTRFKWVALTAGPILVLFVGIFVHLRRRFRDPSPYLRKVKPTHEARREPGSPGSDAFESR